VNEWELITAEFEMPGGVSRVKLRISNAVEEYSGNDIAIDDIGFRPMGPSLEFVVSPQLPACTDDEVTFTARVLNESEAYFTNHFILQRKENGSTEEWENVGEDDEDGGIKESKGINPVTFTLDKSTDYNNNEYR